MWRKHVSFNIINNIRIVSILRNNIKTIVLKTAHSFPVRDKILSIVRIERLRRRFYYHVVYRIGKTVLSNGSSLLYIINEYDNYRVWQKNLPDLWNL